MLPPRQQLPKLTDRLPLGTSGLEVSPFCSGMTFDEATIPAAYEAGINFFFLTADMHWPYYETVRRGLKNLLASNPSARDSIVVAVAAYVTQPEFCYAPFDEVLEAIDPLQRIDLTIAGGAYGHEIATRLKIYEVHRLVGYAGARAIGATFHDRQAALSQLELGIIDIAYVRYNPTHPKARTEIFQHVKGRGEGRTTLLFNFKSTVGWIDAEEEYAALGVSPENWRPHVTDYYRFALTAPALDGILCGMPGPAGIRELSDALDKGPLDAEDEQYILDLGTLKRRRDDAVTAAKTAARLRDLANAGPR